MKVTEAQMGTIREYNRLDAEHRDRMELKEGLQEIKLALRQVVAKDLVFREDILRLESAIPGLTKKYAKIMGYSEAEFSQQLELGVTLAPNIKASLEALLNDPLMFPWG